MNSPATEPKEPNTPEANPSQKATLGQFIEDNSKLVTSMAAFVALTAFSSQIESDTLRLSLSALTFLAALLLGLELASKLPPLPHHWRLQAFSLTLTVLVFSMAWYWFSKFPQTWVPLLLFMVLMGLFLGVSGLLIHHITRVIKSVAARLFHREIRPEVMHRVSLFLVLLFLAVLAVGFYLASQMLARHPIRIHIPASSKSTVTK